jgi:nucleotidyltransferase/DNA polymerase involved in DNA repair
VKGRSCYMAIACLSIPNFTLRVEILHRPELDGLPLALRSAEDRRPAIVDCTPEALVCGVRPGLLPREALSVCPEVVTVLPNPARDNSVFAGVVERLEALSPLVEVVEPGRCYVDLRGLERHYGTPEQAAGLLLQTAPPILRPRVGIASGKFAAGVAASQAAPGSWRIVEPDEVRAFLAAMPVSVLPVSFAMTRRLEQLGIDTLREFTSLPLSAVQARFGPEGRDAWHLARGIDERPVIPRSHEPVIVERITLPAPATSREAFLIGLRQLVIQAFTRKELHSRNVRGAQIRAELDGGGSWEQTITLKAPAGRDRLIEALRHRLQAVELAGPLAALEIELMGFTAEQARQESLLSARPRRMRQIIDAAHQLKHRYGTSPVYRIVEVEPWSRIPERRRALISFDP